MASVLSPRTAYELWADTYPPEAHNPLMEAEQSIVSRMLEYETAARALDVGTGSGRYLPILRRRAACVIGLDLSMAMLARNRNGHRVRGDACRLPFRSSAFDLVNASLMVGDIADLGGWIQEMRRVLGRGGRLVYSDFHPSWTTRGWQRTFRTADGVQHVIQFAAHSIDEHLSALRSAGFRTLTIREPRLRVGRTDVPVLAIFRAVNEGGASR